MECEEARAQLLGHARGQLGGETRARVDAHLAECADCRRALAAESELSQLLERKLPRHAAPAALRDALAERVRSPARPRRLRRFAAPVASALAAAALVLLVVRVTQPSFLRSSPTADELVAEGVNDHLRVVASAHPVEIESGGIHQVKPWFTGKLDFAPRVAFSGDDDFQLEGGSIGYFRDRKAAVFVFKRRLHTISLFVFRADGLPLTSRRAAVTRGFNVLLWRDGELGYCLVSDVARADLDALAARIDGS